MLVRVFDIGGTTVKAALAQFVGDVPIPTIDDVSRHELPENSFGALRDIVVEVIRQQPQVDAIAISTTGTLSKDQVVLRSGFFRGYELISWADELAACNLDYPVLVMNDGHAVATAENAAATDVDQANTAHFVVGTGVGGGAFVSSNLLLGTSGYGCAFGHIKVDPGISSPPCGCSRRGCVEVFAAAPAIKKGLEKQDINSRSLLPTSDKANELDITAQVFDRAGWWLGRAIGSVINVLNPSLVTVGGGVVDADSELATALGRSTGPYLQSAFDEAVESSLVRAAEAVQLRKSDYGNDAGMLGASVAAFKMLKDQ